MAESHLHIGGALSGVLLGVGVETTAAYEAAGARSGGRARRASSARPIRALAAGAHRLVSLPAAFAIAALAVLEATSR